MQQGVGPCLFLLLLYWWMMMIMLLLLVTSPSSSEDDIEHTMQSAGVYFDTLRATIQTHTHAELFVLYFFFGCWPCLFFSLVISTTTMNCTRIAGGGGG
jgi:predicted secreted protein